MALQFSVRKLVFRYFFCFAKLCLAALLCYLIDFVVDIMWNEDGGINTRNLFRL